MDARLFFRRGLMETGEGLRIACAFALAMVLSAPLVSLAAEPRPLASRPAHAPPGSSLQRPAESDGPPETARAPRMLVLADASDAYYPLAGEIADLEGADLVQSLDEALALDPEFLIWVVSPPHMSDETLVELGLAMGARKSVISVGIISGSTQEQARDLWLRAGDVDGRLVVAANARNPSGNILSGIAIHGPGGTAYRPLTLANMLRYLQRADYFTFTGHGGYGHLELEGETRLRAEGIPELSNIVVATASCSTFRIWEEDSIALAFVDGGAAAYAGFAYSPNEGYLLGEFSGAPMRYTWPGFPIGHVVQMQNRGTLRGFASFPFYHLLGDPRIALQTQPPYRLVEDREKSGVRTLTYSDAPAGFIPVRIPSGAGYSFVEIPGVTSVWERDPYYNARLQMADIGEDKYVLFEHGGGDFSIVLQPSPSWHWPVTDLVSDSLDHVLLYLPQTGGDLISLFLGGLAWLTILRLSRRVARARLYLVASVLAGAVFAAQHAMYASARLDDVTITSKMVQLGPLSLLGTFLVTGAGAYLFLNSRSWRGRVVAVILGTLPTLAAMCFGVAVVACVNLLVFRPELGIGAYNYALGMLPISALVVESLLLLLAFSLLQGLVTRLHRSKDSLGVPGRRRGAEDNSQAS